MNKILVAVIAVVILGSGAFVLLSGDDDKYTATNTATNTTPTNTSTTAPATQPASPATVASAGRYVDYSEQAIADAAGTERVLFFHAEWCSVCNYHEGEIEKSGVPDGITVIKADFDTEDELKDRYGVRVQSTFIHLDENANEIQSWPFASGLRTPQDLFDAVLEG